MLLPRIQENLDSERNESVVKKGFTEQKQKTLCTCVLKLLVFSSRPLKNSNVKSSNYTMSEIRNSHSNSFTFANRTQLCINI